jgi:hypothetical protein
MPIAHLTRAAGGALLACGMVFSTLAPAFADVAAPAAGTAPAAVAQAAAPAANPFADVPTSSWAYDAVAQLQADGFVIGYPDGAFKGARPMTRYEMAVVVSRAVTAIETKLAQGQAVDAAALATLRKLVDEYGVELADIKAKVASLDKRTSALETETSKLDKETASNTESLNRARISMSGWVRGGPMQQYVAATNGPVARTINGVAVPAYGQLPYGVGPAPLGSGTLGNAGAGAGSGLQNAFVVGNYEHGVSEQDYRFAVAGNLDPRFTYGFRLDGLYNQDNRSYLTTTAPAFCSSAVSTVAGVNCGYQDYSTNLVMRVNYAYARYNSPGGFYAQIGRILQDAGLYDSQASVFSGGYSDGIRLGYIDKRVNAWVMQAFGNAALTNSITSTCPTNLPTCAGTGSTSLQGKLDYFFPSTQSDFGFTYDDWNGLPNLSWNPSALLCVNSLTNPTAGSALVALPGTTCPTGDVLLKSVTGAYMTASAHMPTGTLFYVQYFGNKERPQIKMQFEGFKRFSTDPYTGVAWNGNEALYANFDYASKGNLRSGPLYTGTGIKGSNVVDFQYYNAGLNSYGQDSAMVGIAAYTNEFYNSINGMQVFSVALERWFSNYFRAGIVYEHFGLKNGVTIPAGGLTCPGCTISALNANTVFLDTYLIF